MLKPADGAGGDNIFLCQNPDQLVSAMAMVKESGSNLRVEHYVAGKPVSVSIVRNQHETRLLPGTEQQFSNTWNRRPPDDSENVDPEPIGHFVKSAYPLDNDLQCRAGVLASAVADALPTWRGYLGIDMVLTDDGPDVVAELNPRLTASWCRVRKETGFNLIEFLLPAQRPWQGGLK